MPQTVTVYVKWINSLRLIEDEKGILIIQYMLKKWNLSLQNLQKETTVKNDFIYMGKLTLRLHKHFGRKEIEI